MVPGEVAKAELASLSAHRMNIRSKIRRAGRMQSLLSLYTGNKIVRHASLS